MGTSKLQTLKDLITLEEKRKFLADGNDIKSLIKTYKMYIPTKNRNDGKFWDSEFSKTTKVTNFVENHRNKIASSWLKNLDTSKILNIGCGDGEFERLFLKDSPEIDYQGLDFQQ